MEIRDAAQRLFRVHRWLLFIAVMLGLLAGAAVHYKLEARTYTASARLDLGGTTPQSTAEAAALAGTIQGIVTSPDRIAGALAAAHLTRDPVIFATKDVNTQPVSASGILELQVTDTNPGAAAAVANYLADGAVTTLNAEKQAGLDAVQTQLRTQSAQLAATIAADDAQLAVGGLSLPQQTALVAARSDASQRLTAIGTNEANVALQAASTPRATVVDAAVTPDRPDPSRLVLDIILGLVAGLVAGLGGAALLETVRPTAVGRRGVEAALGAPVVGTVDRGTAGVAQLGAVSERVCRVARRAEVSSVLLWSPRADLDLSQLAGAMQAGLRARPSSGARPRAGAFEFAVLRPEDASEPRQGVVAVLMPVTRVSKLEAVRDLCRDGEWPLVGAVLMAAPAHLLSRIAREAASAKSSEEAAAGADGKHLRVVESPRNQGMATVEQSNASTVGR
jgi:capsular polysaccharide biosynthesis protein